jgi:haloalkane dehalogenase
VALGYAIVPGMPEAGGLAYREAGDAAAPSVLLVHGYPESSYMWRHALDAVAAAGWRGVAPDLAGFGDSEPPDDPATWEYHVASLEHFRRTLGLDDVVVVTHDWGVLIGLRWACDNPGAVRGVVVSDGGFFADRRWHDLANVMRTPGEGEQLVSGYTREGLEGILGQLSSGMGPDAFAEYWKGFASSRRRRGHLELYRSGDFSKLEPYEGCVAALGVPVLVMWGGEDRFSSARMADRYVAEIPDAERVVFDRAGHFIWEDEPEATSRALVDFLELRVRTAGGRGGGAEPTGGPS